MNSNPTTSSKIHESLRRCVGALDDLIGGCDDPGTEALGAVYEAKSLLRSEPPAEVVLDLGDEDGRWIGCEGHVDRYDFMTAYAEYQGQDVHVGPYLQNPRHVFMVEFDLDEDDDPEYRRVWWQLEPKNDEAASVLPVTVLYLGEDDPATPALVDRNGNELRERSAA